MTRQARALTRQARMERLIETALMPDVSSGVA